MFRGILLSNTLQLSFLIIITVSFIAAQQLQEEIIDPYLISLPYEIRLEKLNQMNILISDFNKIMLSSRGFPVYIRESQTLYNDSTPYDDSHDESLWNQFAKRLDERGYDIDQPKLVTINCPDQILKTRRIHLECFEMKVKGVNKV